MLHLSVGLDHTAAHISAAANKLFTSFDTLSILRYINTVPGQSVLEHALVSLDESPTQGLYHHRSAGGLVRCCPNIRVCSQASIHTSRNQSPHSQLHEFQLPSTNRKHINADFEQNSNSSIACHVVESPT